MKARLAGAHKGHGLLKKKADALQMRFRMILSKIIEVMKIHQIPLETFEIGVLIFSSILDKNFDGRCYERSSIFLS